MLLQKEGAAAKAAAPLFYFVMLNLFQHLANVVCWIDPDTSQAILSLVILARARKQEEGTSSG